MAHEIDYQDYQMALQFDKRASRLGALEPLVHGLIDSLYLREDHRVLDVGTGAGFPAVPLAVCCPQWKLTAIDGTAKKARFVAQVTESLEIISVLLIFS